MKADGIFVAVVGPSGAGKDSLINRAREELKDDDGFVFPRRMITRPADVTEQSESSTPEIFREVQGQGAFALHWEAHGLLYGVPAAVHVALAEGRVVVANISRGAVAQARQRFQRTCVILVRAEPAILAERLRLRGREAEADQLSRLRRSADLDRSFQPDAIIDNNGSLEAAGLAFVRMLRELTGKRLFALGL